MYQHWQVHVQLQCFPTTLDIFHSEVYTYSIGGMMLRCSVVIWVYSFIAFDISGEASVSNLSYWLYDFDLSSRWLFWAILTDHQINSADTVMFYMFRLRIYVGPVLEGMTYLFQLWHYLTPIVSMN